MEKHSNDTRLAALVLWLLFIGLDGTAQLLFKNAAVHLPEPSFSPEWLYAAATSGRVWAGLTCLALVFVVWMTILRRLPLATAFPTTALTFVVVVAGSQLLFGEAVAPLQYLGIALIVAGVAMLRPTNLR